MEVIAINLSTKPRRVTLANGREYLVADAGLGTINGIVLTVRALLAAGLDQPLVVLLNRYDDADALHRANADWLRTREGLDVVTDVEALAERFT